MDLIRKLEEYRAQEQALAWEGTFADYFEIVKRNPQVAQLAHARIFNMIMAAGVEVGKRGETQLQLLRQRDLRRGAPVAADRRVLQLGAQRLEVRKRILLLMGPVGGGKSTIVSMLKRGLEAYSRTEAGAVYAINGCPMHEEPLHLIPREPARRLRARVRHLHRGRPLPALPLRPGAHLGGPHRARAGASASAFSEKHRVGIGTFTPSRPQEPGHLASWSARSTFDHRRSRLGERPARLPLRRRAEHRQPRHDGIHRDAQGRRALPLCAAHAVAGAEHQDRPLLA